MPDPLQGRLARGASHRVRTGIRTMVACCDGQIPACSSCERNRLVCLVEDPVTRRQQPRNYTTILEERVEFLERRLRGLLRPDADKSPPPSSPPSAPTEDDKHIHISSAIGALSLKAAGSEPCFLGPSSTFAFSRFIGTALRQPVSAVPFDLIDRNHHDLEAPGPCQLPDHPVAVRLSNAYFQNIHPQYPFLHEPTFRMWEHALKDPIAVLNLQYQPGPLFFMNMVYSIGALLLPTAGYAPEELYASALLYIDDILCHDTLESIQALLCCAAYSLRSSRGTSHWKLATQAVCQCVNLGYHRNSKQLGLSASALQKELQKRTFWSAYAMECSAAVMLGRPLSLRFQEIDAELPLDISDACLTETEVNGSTRRSLTDTPTIMTYGIHAFRIRSLLGCIQTQIYADTTLSDPEICDARVRELSDRLENWKASIPPPMPPPESGTLSFFTTPDWYQANYNLAILHLFRVQITNQNERGKAVEAVFSRCLFAAKDICHSYRRQFIGKPTTCTWGALHNLFLAGLTYLYCLWMSPEARRLSRHDQISSTCIDCTMVLVVLAERWADAAPYRDIFEALASSTMTMIADSQQGDITAQPSHLSWEEYCPKDLSQWVENVAEGGNSSGIDQLMSGFMEDLFPS